MIITIGIQSKSESDEEDPEGYAFREVIDTSMKDDDKLSPGARLHCLRREKKPQDMAGQ